jgi:CDP-diacylglycerol---serine O-phosphatidyltransferase
MRRGACLIFVNSITACGLFLGCASILAALQLNLPLQCGLLTLCLLADGADGFWARRLGVVTKFGGYADTVSDFVAFGISPAIALLMSPHLPQPVAFALSLLWIGASAARLFHFWRTNDSRTTSFNGLPLAAASFALMSWLIISHGNSNTLHFLAAIIALTALMLSRVTFHRDPVTLIVSAILAFMMMAVAPDIQRVEFAAMYASLAYVIVSAARAAAPLFWTPSMYSVYNVK